MGERGTTNGLIARACGRDAKQHKKEKENKMGIVSEYQPPSKFFKAEDIQGGEMVMTIKGHSSETFNDGRTQPTLLFHETDKSLGLNATNRKKLAELFGEAGPDGTLDVEPDALIGQRIAVYRDTTKNQSGATVPCVRIRAMRANAQPAKQSVAPAAQDDAAKRMEFLVRMAAKTAYTEQEQANILRGAAKVGIETAGKDFNAVVQMLIAHYAEPVPF